MGVGQGRCPGRHRRAEGDEGQVTGGQDHGIEASRKESQKGMDRAEKTQWGPDMRGLNRGKEQVS